MEKFTSIFIYNRSYIKSLTEEDISFLDKIIDGPFDQNIKHMLNNLKEANTFDKLFNEMQEYVYSSSTSYVKINLKLSIKNLKKGNMDRYKYSIIFIKFVKN